ncbi:MAG: hypothetical protein EBU26_06940 [Verrucomicrobia bacterium]|nr:hypothetical protein [Verrucomicrobiota bacterium]
MWSNLILGWLMGHAEPSWPILGWLCLGGSLAYVGGMYLNDAMDVSFDRSFRPERPIPAGAISLLAVHCLGWGQLLLGAWLLWAIAKVELLPIMGLMLSVVTYNALHKHIAFSPVLMAACRFFLVLIGYDAGEGSAWWGGALWPALALAAYIVGLTYVAKRESAGGAIAWWPCLFLYFPVLMACLMHHPSLWPAMILPSLLFLAWTLWCLRHVFWGGQVHVGRAVSGLLAGMPMVDMLFMATQEMVWLLATGGCFLAARLFQRFIPAT